MSAEQSGVPLLRLQGVRRVYDRGDAAVAAVDGVDLVVHAGETLAIEGSSGSGKSTLLAMIGGLERPTAGSIRFHGRDLADLSDRELTALRATEIGFVFQGFNLVPTLTARQNVEAVMAPLRLSAADQRARAHELLERVGLGHRAGHLPTTMSGGEQQRVAIARAIANNPRVLLADEPTGNLDSATAAEVVAMLRGLTADLGVTVVLVTHDHDLALQAPRRIQMRDGRVVGAPAPVAHLSLVASSPARPRTAGRPVPRGAALVGCAAGLVALMGAAVVATHQPPPGQPAASRLAAGPPSHRLSVAPEVAQPRVPAVAPHVVSAAAPRPTQEAVAPSRAQVPEPAQPTTRRSSRAATPHRSSPMSSPTPAAPRPTKVAPEPSEPTPTAPPAVEPTPVEPPVTDPAPTTTGTTFFNPLWFLTGTWWQGAGLGSGR